MDGLALILRLRISEGVVLAPLGPDDFVRLVARWQAEDIDRASLRYPREAAAGALDRDGTSILRRIGSR